VILILYVSTTVFITQGEASEAGVYPLLLLPRGNARVVVLSYTMTMSCRIREKLSGEAT